jgi:DNA-binding LacI/PurR family transcriptional regulator
MLNMPQRQTLTRQTVDALREGMASGIWKGFLPGERELCSFLQISRPTLRAALEIVEREGLIAVKQGKRSSILKKRRVLRPGKAAVALVSKLPLYSMSRNRIFLIDYMSKVLQERGLRLEIVSHPAFGTNRPARALQHLRERGNFRAFVLTLSSQAVQQWFCDNSLPSIALGSTFPGLAMPSVDTDYQSMGRHAAGIFLGKSHRRIVWIIPEANHAGDLETEASFLESLHRSGDPSVQCRIIRHGSSSRDLLQKINALLSSAEPPTAFFVVNAFATTALVTHLLSRGLRIPHDVSVIAREYDPLLEWIHPPIAHYISPLRRIASRISREVVAMATEGPFPLRHIRIIPQFCKAESLAVCPEPARQPHQLVMR